MNTTPKKLDAVSLALELQSLESETFEIQDYAAAGEMVIEAAASTTSTTSSTTSTCSCCA
jgi:thiazolylpeptide-type bacteriocin precursor